MTSTTLEDREDWKRYKAAMKVIAAKFGVPVRCIQKYKYLNVNFGIEGLTKDEIAALHALEELVMYVSEFPEGVLQRLDPKSLSVFDGNIEHADTIRTALVQCLAPARIIIFGSAARGDAREGSDIDVAVIRVDGQPVTLNEIVRARMALRDALGSEGPAIDLVMTDVRGYEAQKSASVWSDVHREGIQIYP